MTQAEKDFDSKIDCNFPYQDREKCLRLIDEAAALTDESLFRVTEELCGVPQSKKNEVKTANLEELLEIVKSKVNHPLKDIVFDTASRRIHGNEVPVEDTLKNLEVVRRYPGQYAALNILYFTSEYLEEILEPVYETIVEEWRNKCP